MQPKPLKEWIEKGHQRDANLCGACARPTDERSLVGEEGGYNPDLIGISKKIKCQPCAMTMLLFLFITSATSLTKGSKNLKKTLRVPNLVGKTVHIVGGLACILGLTKTRNQSP